MKHRGKTTDFAWGERSPQAITWAAFFGDCEHEVMEVTKGHRVTLTYNLYRTSIANLARPVADPDRLPLYRQVKDLLANEAFLPEGEQFDLRTAPVQLHFPSHLNPVKSSLSRKRSQMAEFRILLGGELGFFCNHRYAHAHDAGRKSIPAAFKGVDLAVFTTFHSLGLKTEVRPVLKDGSEYDWHPKWGGLSVKELFKLKGVKDFNKKMKEKMNLENDEWDPEDYDPRDPELQTVVGTTMHGLMTQDYYIEQRNEVS